MVASINGEPYSPFEHPSMVDDGPQSSEEGSGLHSPVFDTQFPDSHFRYHQKPLDIHHATGLIAAHYQPYSNGSSLGIQCPPLSDAPKIDIPPGKYISPADSDFDLSPHFAVHTRNTNYTTHSFSIQSPTPSRIPSNNHSQDSGAGLLDFRYDSSEQRLPGQQSYDQPPSYRTNGNSSASDANEDRLQSDAATVNQTASASSPTRDSPHARKEISTVVIACRQCRFRKIRCDSTRPVCNNCVRRSNVCEYDAMPKRRGPDKKPGTRQRSCKKRPAPPSDPAGASGSGQPQAKRARTQGSSTSPANDRVRLKGMGGAPAEGELKLKENVSSATIVNEYPPVPSHGDLRISTDPVYLKSEHSQPRRHPTSPHATYAYPQVAANVLADPRSPITAMLSPGSTTTMHSHSHERSQLYAHPKFSGPPTQMALEEQKAWWDSFLGTYSIKDVGDDLTFVISECGHHLNFLNSSFLVGHIFSPVDRLSLQPSFILAALALAWLMKSSESSFRERQFPGDPTSSLRAYGDYPATLTMSQPTQRQYPATPASGCDSSYGRSKAIMLRDSAKEALESALKTGTWVDAQLAEAALILALFESSAHPQYHPDRVTAALTLLDTIIHNLGLNTIDINDSDQVTFHPHAVPVVPVPLSSSIATTTSSPASHRHAMSTDIKLTSLSGESGVEEERQCRCIPPGATHPPDPYNTWSYPLSWDASWTVKEIRDEECRRLCWSTLGLVSAHTAQGAAFEQEGEVVVGRRLALSEASNWHLVFPGEVLDRVSLTYRASDSHSTKESVWALYCRSMLLWIFCDRARSNSLLQTVSDEDRAEFSGEAWNETQAILDSLAMHVCNLDTALIYMTKEYMYNARMAITQMLRSLSGLSSSTLFNRKQADEWILYEQQVIKRVQQSFHDATETQGYHRLSRRPFQVSWFHNQLALALRVWNSDRSLLAALELGKSILTVVEVMNGFWPCPLFQHQAADMRIRLSDACALSGLEPPIPPHFSIPTQLSPTSE